MMESVASQERRLMMQQSAPHTYGSVVEDPAVNQRSRGRDDLKAHLLYHFLNVVLGLIGILTCPIVFLLGVATLPVCCCGVLLLHLLVCLVRYLARLDVHLYNIVASRETRIQINPPLSNPTTGFRLSMALGSPCSGDTMVATVYLGLFKFPIAIILASMVTGLVVSSALLLSGPLIALLDPRCSIVMDHVCVDGSKAVLLVVPGLLLAMLSRRVIKSLTYASMSVTRWCCCEYCSAFLDVYAPIPAYCGQSGIRIV